LEHISHNIRVGGHTLNSDVWDAGRRAHVLLLHGLGGNTITWHAAAPHIAKQLQARVLAIDLPGFGASRATVKRLSLNLLARVTVEAMRGQGRPDTRWHLAGNSLGGLIALDIAARHRELVERVTLASVALPLFWGREPNELLAIKDYAGAAIPILGRRSIASYVKGTGVPGVVDDPVRFLFRDPSRLDPELRRRLIAVSSYRLTWADEAARALEQTTRSLGVALLNPLRSRRWFAEVHCPVRVIYGTHDPLFPEQAWQKLQRVRPDWQHVSMQGVGHVPQLEAPDEFAAHMTED
jgi:pimeloyl-ACP methyl ester carboxylesterase